MKSGKESSAMKTTHEAVDVCLSFAISEACRRIPPMWPLKDFVAVNPFLGMADQHFLQVAALLQRVGHGDIMMSKDYYLERLHSGEITDGDMIEAVALARLTLPPPWSARLRDYNVQTLQEELSMTEDDHQAGWTLSVADFVDQGRCTQWTPFVIDEISKWCSVYFDEGQSSWRMPWRDQSLYQAWLGAARHDANPELSGLKSFRRFIHALPENPLQTIEKVLSVLAIPPGFQADFLHRQLLGIAGWSAHVQYRVRQDEMQDRKNQTLTELLAVRLAYDWVLWEQYKEQPGFVRAWSDKVRAMQQFHPALELLPRYLVLGAAEKSYQRRLAARLLSAGPEGSESVSRPVLQAVFCIDVRSEIYRRHLEAQDKNIKTSGFAGFFGMPIEYVQMGQLHGSAQCPVLFTPKFKVEESLRHDDERATERVLGQRLFAQRLTYGWNAFKTSAISCFSFVETAGLWFGCKLGRDALAMGHAEMCRSHTAPRLECRSSTTHRADTGIPFSDQLDLAEGALRNLGLISGFPRLVLFCGHGSTTANNPYASALDCGACGGHAGQVNARVAARILNQIEVRQAIRSRGIAIPDDTHFVAGQHNTTTDEVELFEDDALPDSHAIDWDRLRDWLDMASGATRAERSERLGLNKFQSSIGQKIRRRSRDWAQVRPEWGLANNAALIAAPRARTRGIHLEGRTFLHDYAASTDPEGKVLELILTAPVVVASWINLQYYASTVNNRLFGSGNKTIHNVVGSLGIWQGNGGDLQTGLPLQSLHNGENWMHEPLRLSVFVESSQDAINRVLTAHPEVRELVQNGWMALFALGSSTGDLWQYTSNLSWRKVGASAGTMSP